ncbi:hypothetical protein AGMMS4952_26410 [Spirochaetia bacterium]|nr:hypothetical protein AGMMS4952_26410 [Spirochaetia bacterium]
MDANVVKLFDIAAGKIGIRFVKQLFSVLLILFGVERKQIFEKLGVAQSTLGKYKKLIDSGNIEEIFNDNVYRQKSELEDYKDEILKALNEKPVQTLREASVVIEKVSGLKRSIPQIWYFLKKTNINL